MHFTCPNDLWRQKSMHAVSGQSNAFRRTDGSVVMEFVLILMASLALFLPIGEMFRISMYDQALARATHQGARAAAADPANCETAIVEAFQADRLARWLLDLNNDSRIDIVSRQSDWPEVSAGEEVQITVVADADLFDGDDWEVAGSCGSAGSWIRVRSRVVIQPGFAALRLLWPGGVRRQQQSWARNQAT